MTVGKNKTLEYDVENRLTSVINPLSSESYLYDGDGGRVRKTMDDGGGTIKTTTYIGSLYEVESGGKTTKHIFAGATRVASVEGSVAAGFSLRYYHTDHLGSSSIITDETGVKVSSYEYEPYGKVTQQTGTSITNYKFIGKELDSTGLYFYGARYYDPEIGRFISADSLVQDYKNPQTFNRYTYCNNNPINYTDPSGHSWFNKFWKTAVSAVVGIAAFIGSGFNPAVGFQAFSLTNSALNLGTAIATGQGIGQAIGSLAASFAISVGFSYLGIHDIVNPVMRMAGFAVEGAMVGAASSAISGGDIGQGAAFGAATGAAMGFFSSEQFQNWRTGEGFLSNEAVAKNNMQIAKMSSMVGERSDYELAVAKNGTHLDLVLRDTTSGTTEMWGKFPNRSQDKSPGSMRNLAYVLGKKVNGVIDTRLRGGEVLAVYGVNGEQAAMLRSYANNKAGAFALSTNCANWAMGGLRSTGIFVPKHEYNTLGFADPNKFGR